MSEFTRRLILKGAAAGAVAGVAGVALVSPATAELTPDARLQAAIEELKAAFHAAHPGLVETWTVKVHPDIGCPILVAGFTA